jgi:rhodanese-related sulfurtransferase
VSDQISVGDLKAWLDAGKDFILLDVREPFEIREAALEPSLKIPMAHVAARLAELPRDKAIAVLCHSGYRSDRVARYLRGAGFPHAASVAGGIDAWSQEINPAVPRY